MCSLKAWTPLFFDKMPNKKCSFKSSTEVTPQLLCVLVSRIQSTVLCRDPGMCWRSSLKLNGRGHVQFKHDRVKYLGHRIMAFALCKSYTAYDPATKMQASHRCGNRWCINPGHLVLENCLVNQTRDCCRMFSHKQDYKCPHEPECILGVSHN